MSLPPVRYPRSVDNLWNGHDPFDGKHRNADAERSFTPLGCLLETYAWYWTHKSEIGPAFTPIASSIRKVLAREAAGHLTDIECRRLPD